MFKTAEEQLQIIGDGLVDLISREELLKKLEYSRSKNKPLRVKYGTDPSAPDLHLGHTVPLRKLRQFQALGLLFGFGSVLPHRAQIAQRAGEVHQHAHVAFAFHRRLLALAEPDLDLAHLPLGRANQTIGQ